MNWFIYINVKSDAKKANCIYSKSWTQTNTYIKECRGGAFLYFQLNGIRRKTSLTISQWGHEKAWNFLQSLHSWIEKHCNYPCFYSTIITIHVNISSIRTYMMDFLLYIFIYIYIYTGWSKKVLFRFLSITFNKLKLEIKFEFCWKKATFFLAHATIQ